MFSVGIDVINDPISPARHETGFEKAVYLVRDSNSPSCPSVLGLNIRSGIRIRLCNSRSRFVSATIPIDGLRQGLLSSHSSYTLGLSVGNHIGIIACRV